MTFLCPWQFYAGICNSFGRKIQVAPAGFMLAEFLLEPSFLSAFMCVLLGDLIKATSEFLSFHVILSHLNT